MADLVESRVYLGAFEETTTNSLLHSLTNVLGDVGLCAIKNGPERRRHWDRSDPPDGLLRHIGEVEHEPAGEP